MVNSLLHLVLLAVAGVSVFAGPHFQRDTIHLPGLDVPGLIDSQGAVAQEAVLPAPSFVKVRRAVDLTERASTKAVAASYYSAFVAIGASYTDNAHSRSAANAGSLRQYYPYSSAGGRYSNGAVAVEYMVQSGLSPALKQQSGGVKLFDYAYGGSVIQNGLSGTAASWPAAKDQIASYLSDLKSGGAKVGSGRVLHYANSGINSVSQIWSNTLSNGFTDSGVVAAKRAISANTQALAAAIRTINNDATVYSTIHGSDFLLVGLPQLDLVPSIANQVPSTYTVAKRVQALSFMQTLVNQFNSELKTFSVALKSEAKNGKVYFYDLAALWRSMQSSPASYGITASPVTKACYNSATGSVCGNPTSYLYFDTLHPVTSIHKLIAQKMNALVNSY